MLPLQQTELTFAVLIPARYQSSRFPGKPLIDLKGKTMIQHVWERCCLAVGKDHVYIATDSDLIEKAALEFGAQVAMTSDTCMTGTDRLAEANRQLNCDFIINVQGDEPLINPDDIVKVINTYIANPNQIINAMCHITEQAEFESLTVPKVVTSLTGNLLYMSRAAIPHGKTGVLVNAMKQVCIYAFSSEHLQFFSGHETKTPIEQIEDIEILRFLENDIPVKMVEVDKGSIAIDIPEDIEHVIAAMEKNEKNSSTTAG